MSVCMCVLVYLHYKGGVKGGTNNNKNESEKGPAIDGKINEHFITSVEKLI